MDQAEYDLVADQVLGWLMCEHPERAPDGSTHVHLVNCAACRIGAEAAARHWPARWKIVYELQTLYWKEQDVAMDIA